MRGPLGWLGTLAARGSCLAALGLALAVSPAHAGWPPEMTGSVGHTLAITGQPDEGGFSIAVGALWPVQGPVRFGVSGFADDMGARLGRLSDPNDGADLGTVSLDHRMTLGGAWRLDADFPARHGWAPFASGTWGVYRVADDSRGKSLGSVGTTGFSLGAGVRRPLAGRFSFGASVRYHRLFNDRAGRFVAAGVDWAWR